MSLALSQDVILLLSFLLLTPSFDHCCGQLFLCLLLFFGDPSLGALTRTKVNDKLFSSSVSPSLSLCLFPLYLNQKFLISTIPLGRDLVYVRALGPSQVHRLQSEFLKDEKEKRSETVLRENRKEQRNLNLYELFNSGFLLNLLTAALWRRRQLYLKMSLSCFCSICPHFKFRSFCFAFRWQPFLKLMSKFRKILCLFCFPLPSHQRNWKRTTFKLFQKQSLCYE